MGLSKTTHSIAVSCQFRMWSEMISLSPYVQLPDAPLKMLQMGLGKTAQSIAVLELLRQQLGHRGPFLIIAPLTTLHHWEREINTWTSMVGCLAAFACHLTFSSKLVLFIAPPYHFAPLRAKNRDLDHMVCGCSSIY